MGGTDEAVKPRAGVRRQPWRAASWAVSIAAHVLVVPVLLGSAAFVWDDLPAVRSMAIELTPRSVMPAPAPPPPPAAPASNRRAVAPTPRPPASEPDEPVTPASRPAPPVPNHDAVSGDVGGVEGGVPGGVPGGVVGGVPGGIVGGVPSPAPADPAPPPPAPHARPAPVRVGGDVTPPVKLRDAKPVYPAVAEASGVEGVVVVEATIDEDGRVADARVLRSVPLLDPAALAAVRAWRFAPTVINGRATRVIWTTTVQFSLPRPRG